MNILGSIEKNLFFENLTTKLGFQWITSKIYFSQNCLILITRPPKIDVCKLAKNQIFLSLWPRASLHTSLNRTRLAGALTRPCSKKKRKEITITTWSVGKVQWQPIIIVLSEFTWGLTWRYEIRQLALMWQAGGASAVSGMPAYWDSADSAKKQSGRICWTCSWLP